MPICLSLVSPIRHFHTNFKSTLNLVLLLTSLLASNAYAAATLSGKVVDTADGTTPVHPVAIDLMDIATGESLHGVTNLPDGSYEFTDVTPGDYLLFFNAVDGANAYIDELYDEYSPCSDGGCDRVTFGTSVNLAEGPNTVDESLEAGILITGTVTEAGTGTPIEGVSVGFYDGSGAEVHSTQTQSDGSFGSGGLPPQNLYVVADGSAVGYVTEIYDDVLCQGTDCIPVAGSATQVNPGAGGTVVTDFDLDQIVLGSISGNITGSDTALPIEGITLWLFNTDCGFIGGSGTDVNGDYVVEVPDPGDYYLFAIGNDAQFIDQQSPYMNQQYPDINVFDSCYPVLNDVTLGEAISVADSEQVGGKDFILEPGGVMRGTISDINGVLANETGVARLYKTDGQQQTVVLNLEGDGSYRMGGLLPGSYHMVLSANNLGLIDERYDNITCPRNSCDLALGQTFEIVTGTEEITGIDALLDSGAVIRGNLTDAGSGSPVTGYCIYFYTEAGVYAGVGCSDDFGNFESRTGLPIGNYRLSNYFPGEAVADGYIPQVWTNDGSFVSCGTDCDVLLGDTFAVNGTSPVEDIDMAMLTSLTISGTVTADIGAAPLEGIRMTVSRKSDGARLQNTYTDSSGYYEFTFSEARDDLVVWTRTVTPQPYFPEIYQDQVCIDGFCDVEEIMLGTSIDITTGSKVVDMSLARSASLSGTLSRSDPAGLLGNFQGRARLHRQSDNTVVAVAFTDANGVYQLVSIEPGNYYLRLSGNNNNLIDELYDDANGIYCPELFCDKSSARVFTITGTEDVINIDATLDSGTRFSGHVSENGAPLDNIFINFYAETGELVGFGRTGNDGSGNYVTYTGFPAGNYRASNRWIKNGEQQPGNDQYIATVYPNTPCGTPCDVTAGGIIVAPGTATTVSGIDFKTYPAVEDTAVIYGTVTADDGGAPLNDIKVCVVNKNDSEVEACEITDSLGTYLIGNLAPTTDYVVFTKDVGGQAFYAEVHDNQSCCDTSAGTSVDLTGGDAMINFGLAASGRIAGIVRDSVTDEPIPNVTMYLFDADFNQINNIAIQTDDGDFPGQYAFSGVPDGIFYVFAESEWNGYSNELYPDIKRFRAWNGAITDGQAIVIENRTQVDGIDFDLDPASTINGTISDVNGILPFNRGRIRLYEWGSRTTLHQWGNWNEDSTYTVPGLPPGTYSVILTSRGLGLVGERFDDVPCPTNSCDLDLGTPVVVGPQEEVTGIDAVLEPGTIVAGIISDAGTEQGVGNFCLGIYTADGIYAGFACTDQDGNYGSVTAFPPGEYRAANQIFNNEIVGGYIPQVWTEDGSFISCGVPCDVLLGDTFTLTSTDPSPAVNFAMEKGSTISGNVQFGGSPLEGVDVILMSESGTELTSAKSDSSGNFLFDGLGSGNYYVRTLNSLGYQDRLHAIPTDVECTPDCNPYSGTIISLAASDDISGIDFSLGAAAGISGLITDGDTNPIPGIVVEVVNTQANLVSSAITNADGEYSIGGISEGEYFVRTRNQLGFLDRLYGGQICAADCDPLQGDPVVIPAELTNAVDIDIQLPGGGVISGTVTGDDGTQLIPLAGTYVRIYASSGTLAANILTDGNGDYEAAGLAAGDYHVISNNGRTSVPYVGEDLSGAFCQQGCDVLTTPTATLSDGQILDIDFQLQKGQSIKVLVTDSVGELISGGFIAFDQKGNVVRSGKLIRYKKFAVKAGEEPPPPPEYNGELGNLAPGEYYVKVSAGNNYQSELYNDIPCYEPCDPLQGTKVVVTDEPSAEILQITLLASNTISGSVNLAGSDPLTGLAGITVMLYTDTGNLLYSAATDQDGNYAFSGLPNGNYRLKSGGNTDYVDQVFGGTECSPSGCDILAGNLIRITGSDQSNLNFQLTQGGTISGYARDPSGNVLYGTAYLFGANGTQIEVAIIQNNGLFIFSGIADGTYYVYVDAQSRVQYSTSCHYHYTWHFDHEHRETHCWTNTYYTSSTDTLFNGVACPGLSCDPTTGTAITLGSAGSASLLANTGKRSVMAEEPSMTQIEIVMATGHQIKGSVKTDEGQPLAFVQVHFFNQEGVPVGSTVTDGEGSFVSTSGLPDGTYFAATSRAAVASDDTFTAEDAEAGVGMGLQDAAWSGFNCDGICAPSQASGFGTPIVINGADETGIDIILTRAPGIKIEKLTNGQDADTPNGGEASVIAAGETVNWTYELSNTGGDNLINVMVVDDKGVVISCPETTLASDTSMTCTGSGAALNLANDPFDGVMGNCDGTTDSRLYQNTATVTAETAGGTGVDDTDTSHYCNPVPKEEVIFKSGFE